jgi:hypothetical protein
VAGTWYKLDDASAWTQGTTFTVSGQGSHTITFFSKDLAGNTETVRAKSFTVAGAPTELGVPVVPKEAGAGKTFTVWGTISPQFPAGETTVTLWLFRYDTKLRKWVYVRDYATVNADFNGITKYTAKVKLTTKANYRFRAKMNGVPTSPYSAILPVKAIATVGIPKAPTAVAAGKTFTVSGTLKPRFPSGQKTVKVNIYRYTSSKWVYLKTLSAVNSNYSSYSKYTLKTKLTTKGTYRFRAKTLSTTKWAAATTSPSKTMKVR